MNKSSLIPGLFDEHLEFVAIGKDLGVVYRGMAMPFSSVPENIKDQLRVELSNDSEAQQALDKWGLVDHDDRLRQFTWCRYGGSDLTPDLKQDGTLNPDYHECGSRGECPFENIICKNPYGITAREREILVMIAKGLAQKVIAAELGIVEATVSKARKSLFDKTGTASSVQLAQFAFNHKYICHD